MKVSLSTSFSPVKAPGTNTHGAPMLAPKGARVILGSDGGELIQTITPAPHMMFGPPPCTWMENPSNVRRRSS